MNKKTLLLVLLLIGLFLGWFVATQARKLSAAHSTFENYYAFRGCSQLVDKGADYGICKTASGQTIKIVQYKNKWYLDGDLPWGCVGSVCLGW